MHGDINLWLRVRDEAVRTIGHPYRQQSQQTIHQHAVQPIPVFSMYLDKQDPNADDNRAARNSSTRRNPKKLLQNQNNATKYPYSRSRYAARLK